MIILTSLAAWHASSGIGATFDEPFYINKGLERWRTGSYRALMRAGTMPLPVDVQTLPLAVLELIREREYHPFRDVWQTLPVARAMNLPFWWLLLIAVFRLGWLWASRRAAWIAVGLLACEPSLLAHVGLATTDLAVTASVVLAAYLFAAHREQTWPRRVLLPGLAYGTALLCKASALLFVPLILAVIGLQALAPISGWRDGWLRSAGLRRDMLGIGLIGFSVMFLYVGSDWTAERSFTHWADRLPDNRPGTHELRWVAEHLRIFPNAGEGLVQQIKHNLRGHGSYALGEWHPRAVWYYFPVVLSAKLTEPWLLALAVAAVSRGGRQSPAVRLALVLVVFSLSCRVQIGYRLMFPIVPFLALAAATSLASRLRLALAVLAAAAAVAVLHHADGLKYQNQLWGGAATAAVNLTDSNYDWGQDLPHLKRWWQTHGEPRLHVWYYGADPAVLYPPFRLIRVQHEANPSPEHLKRAVGDGYLAMSASFFTGCPDRRPATLALIAWLKTQQPAAQVGAFTLYRFNS